MLFGVVLVFIMQIGFSMLEVGSVNIKNTKNILVKNLIDASVITLTWWGLGHSMAFGTAGGGGVFSVFGSGGYFLSHSLPDITKYGFVRAGNTSDGTYGLSSSPLDNRTMDWPDYGYNVPPTQTAEIIMSDGSVYSGSAFWLYQWVCGATTHEQQNSFGTHTAITIISNTAPPVLVYFMAMKMAMPTPHIML
jgi:hypothetical protein